MKTSSTLYGKLEFWEKRYVEYFQDSNTCIIITLRNPKPFDWYQNYEGVKDIVTQFIKKDSKILNVGCGNSCKHLYDLFTVFLSK